MRTDNHSKKSVFFLLSVLLMATAFIGGCSTAAAPAGGSNQTLIEQRTITDAAEILNDRRHAATPIRARGTSKIQWYDDDKKKQSEKPDVMVVFYPPDYLYFRGDILGQEVIRLGANADEFWYRMKPKEISQYQWGKRKEADRCDGRGWLNPGNLLEAFGMVNVDENWTFSSRWKFDVFELSEQGKTRKKIYVDNSDCLVRKIEYYDADGQTSLTVELDEYTEIPGGSTVATKINIINHQLKGVTVNIKLKNVKPAKPFKAALFDRPSSKGFKYVYRLNENCEWIRE